MSAQHALLTRARRPAARLAGTLLAAALVPGPGLHAQTLLTRVVARSSGAPVVGATARLLPDGDGRSRASLLTDARGRAVFRGLPAGTYRVEVEMIGMSTATSEPVVISPDAPSIVAVSLSARPIELPGVDVEARGDRCSVRPGAEAALTAQLWDEARKALTGTARTAERGRYRYVTERYERHLEAESLLVLDESRERREGVMASPYESRPAEELVRDGFVQDAGANAIYLAPDAAVLLSDAFLDTHCFHFVAPPEEDDGRVGLGFRPLGSDRSVPDIAGTLWIDRSSAELRYLEYTYQYLGPERSSRMVGGRVDFRRMPDGSWIVPEWWIRMPRMASSTDASGRPRLWIEGYRQTGGVVLEVVAPTGRRLEGSPRQGGIEGVVTDSLGMPRAGVSVSVLGSSQEVYTDAEGRYGITGLAPGLHELRVVDPDLAATGLPNESVEREVRQGEMARVDYRLPSLGDLLFMRCRDEPREPDARALLGTVSDVRGRPVAGATVRVEWSGYDFSGVVRGRRARDLRRLPESLDATTDGRGAWAFCGVPSQVPLSLYVLEPANPQEPVVLTIREADVGAVRGLRLSGAGSGGRQPAATAATGIMGSCRLSR